MRILITLILLAITGLLLFNIALRNAGVQDALLDRVIEKRMAASASSIGKGDGLQVLFCGTGSPLPSLKRAQACTAVFAGDKFFLVDAGTGSMEIVQLSGARLDQLAGVLLTHFHSDHIGDLSEAQMLSWVSGRQAPLNVYGPEGVNRVVEGINEAFALDNEYRMEHHGKAIAPPRSAGLRAIEFENGGSDIGLSTSVVYDQDGLRITAFDVSHDPIRPAVGYRFDYQGRSVAVSGDTAYSQNLVHAVGGVDLLIHEAQADHVVEKMRDAAAKAGAAGRAKIMEDILSYHTTPVEAAQAANEAGADWLILTHLTPAPDNRVLGRIFMRGVSDVRKDKVQLAEEGMVVKLPQTGGVEFSK